MWEDGYPDHCPRCFMKYPDIRGVVYESGGEIGGHPCENIWHKGKDYDPNHLELTPDDFEFLKGQLISAR